AVTIMRGLWTEPRFTHQGRRYSTEEAELEPKPGRRIPIWLGTFAPRSLAVTGRLADGWIPSLGYAPPDEVVGMRERVLGAARKAGRDPDEITCVYNVEVRIDGAVGDDPSVVSGSADEVAPGVARRPDGAPRAARRRRPRRRRTARCGRSRGARARDRAPGPPAPPPSRA